MLKKKDLVKQFELVVKQEIIEHNKSIEASNLAVNKLENNLGNLFATLSKDINKLALSCSTLSNKQRDISESLDKIKFLFTNLSNKQYSLNESNDNKFLDIVLSAKEDGKKQELLDKRLGSLEELVISIKQELKETKISLATYLDKTKLDLTKLIKKQKEEILSIPSEAEAVKKEFMKELSMHKIDNAGLLKEIKVLKKTVLINEKKIENLYTLIDRLNKNINVIR